MSKYWKWYVGIAGTLFLIFVVYYYAKINTEYKQDLANVKQEKQKVEVLVKQRDEQVKKLNDTLVEENNKQSVYKAQQEAVILAQQERNKKLQSEVERLKKDKPIVEVVSDAANQNVTATVIDEDHVSVEKTEFQNLLVAKVERDGLIEEKNSLQFRLDLEEQKNKSLERQLQESLNTNKINDSVFNQQKVALDTCEKALKKSKMDKFKSAIKPAIYGAAVGIVLGQVIGK